MLSHALPVSSQSAPQVLLIRNGSHGDIGYKILLLKNADNVFCGNFSKH